MIKINYKRFCSNCKYCKIHDSGDHHCICDCDDTKGLLYSCGRWEPMIDQMIVVKTHMLNIPYSCLYCNYHLSEPNGINTNGWCIALGFRAAISCLTHKRRAPYCPLAILKNNIND